MGKKVILGFMVLSFVVISSSFAAIENVKVSGSFTVNAADRTDFGFGSSSNDDIGVIASTAIVDLNMDISENVEALLTVGEDRAWGMTNKSYTKGVVTLKKILDLPVTLKIGTQPLLFGSGLLIGDADTNRLDGTATTANPYYLAKLSDLSQRASFDSVLAVIDLAPLTVNVGYIKDSEGNLGTATDSATDDDRNAYFLYSTYDFGNKTLLDGYFVMKDTGKARTAREDVSNIGARVVSSPLDSLTLWAEYCYQYGKNSSVSTGKHRRSDFAAMIGFNYSLLGKMWTPSVGMDYTYLSNNWDSMYEAMTPARIANVLLPNTNSQTIGVTLSLNPREDINVKLRYANLNLIRPVPAFGNEFKTSYDVNSGKRGLGNEVDLTLAYDYTEDVQFSIFQDWYIPGKFFASSNQDTATQTVATMKVSF